MQLQACFHFLKSPESIIEAHATGSEVFCNGKMGTGPVSVQHCWHITSTGPIETMGTLHPCVEPRRATPWGLASKHLKRVPPQRRITNSTQHCWSACCGVFLAQHMWNVDARAHFSAWPSTRLDSPNVPGLWGLTRPSDRTGVLLKTAASRTRLDLRRLFAGFLFAMTSGHFDGHRSVVD